ncbi:hypothetical protein BDP27DRAFT_1333378 [Rhodocollybia butyracea]|uniref:Uncharacterized protein n=1 Tax=Rhodocollybia butyracea TaxID=206335 RepID=A0A9P5U337_9AGAR|nr:hypothetical protein BDP27DRAFT_1333378 [Rhodocollybia butyracea]
MCSYRRGSYHFHNADQSCFIFENSDCTGATNGPIQQPGIANLTTIGFNDIVSSFE